jgi:uncharacterized protein (TIGR02594 family)
MKKLEVTPFDLALVFVGIEETAGAASNPHVLSMLRLDQSWPAGDEVAWCSAFVNYIAWLLRLPRSRSLAARSWLTVGASVALEDAEVGFDVVVLQRGAGAQPGPEVVAAPGHVGFYAGTEGGRILLLGGNQGNKVSTASFPIGRLLGIRRLLTETGDP